MCDFKLGGSEVGRTGKFSECGLDLVQKAGQERLCRKIMQEWRCEEKATLDL